MISMAEIGWAAGFLEGEGTFMRHWYKQSRGGNTRSLNFGVSAGQKQREPLGRLVKDFGGRVMLRRQDGHKCWIWYLGLIGGAAGLMMTIYPHMSRRRKWQIRRALTAWRTSPARGARQRAKTACRNGHEYTPENTILFGSGWRKCRACNREWYKRRRVA